jgi:hypothetical protein
MNNDVIRLICEQACLEFGVADTFNGASFASVLARIAGCEGRIDGKYVRTLLSGRPDIEVLEGHSHFRLMSLDAIQRRYKSFME